MRLVDLVGVMLESVAFRLRLQFLFIVGMLIDVVGNNLDADNFPASFGGTFQ